MKKIVASIIVIAFILMIPICSLSEPIDYVISQAYQEKENDTRLHIRVESTGAVAGKPLTLTKDDIQEATLGTEDTPILDIFNVQDVRAGGMSYVFVLDHAMPINGIRLDEMKTGMKNWIQALGENDRVAILVVEEDDVRNVTRGFTDDQNAILDALEDYGKTVENPSKNMVYSGIREAILIASTGVSSHPRNCSIVVFSNGADTYQTRVTLSEISEMLNKNNLPLYVVGFAHSQQKNALATLVEVAKNSGGWAEDATPSNDAGPIDEAFDRLRMRICNSYDITLDCSDGFVTNGLMTVALNLRNPEVLLKRNVELYLLDKGEKGTAVSAASDSSGSAVASAPVDDGSQQKMDIQALLEDIRTLIRGTTNIKGKLMSNGILVLLGACVLGIFIFGICCLFRKKDRHVDEKSLNSNSEEPRTEKTTPSDGTDETNDGKGETEVVREDDKTVRPKNPNYEENGTIIDTFNMLHIDKLTLRYTLPGCEQEEKVFENPEIITIGRVRGNSLVLKERGVSSEHVRISCIGEHVEVENISKVYDGQQNKLLLNGKQVSQNTEIVNGAELILNTVPLKITWTVSDEMSADDSEPPTFRDPDITVRHTSVKLTVSYYIDGQEKSRTLPLVRCIVIGRNPDDHIMIADRTVSRHHLTIERDEKKITLRNTSQNNLIFGKNPIYYNETEILDEFPYVNDSEGMSLYLGQNSFKLDIKIDGI